MLRTIAIYLFILLLITPSSADAYRNIQKKEILGFRAGSVFSSGMLDRAFGKGSVMEVHFIEGLTRNFGIDVSLSSHNFGESKLPQKNLRYVYPNETVEMQIYSLTAGMFTFMNIGGRLSLSAEGGPGLYAITLIRPGIFELSLNDYQPGFYAGLGFIYRLTRENIHLDLNMKYHYIFSGANDEHPLYYYTGDDRTGFFQVGFGVTLITGG